MNPRNRLYPLPDRKELEWLWIPNEQEEQVEHYHRWVRVATLLVLVAGVYALAYSIVTFIDPALKLANWLK